MDESPGCVGWVVIFLIGCLIILLLGGAVQFSVNSVFNSDYEKALKRRAKCLEDLQKQKLPCENISDCLSQFNFEAARKYLACEPDGSFDTKKVSFMDQAEHSENLYKKELEKIVKAEVAFWLGRGEFVRAKSRAQEAGSLETYVEILPTAENDLIEAREFDKAFSVLNEFEDNSVYNTYLESIIDGCLINNDIEKAKTLVKFVRPILENNKENWSVKKRLMKKISEFVK